MIPGTIPSPVSTEHIAIVGASSCILRSLVTPQGWGYVWPHVQKEKEGSGEEAFFLVSLVKKWGRRASPLLYSYVA